MKIKDKTKNKSYILISRYQKKNIKISGKRNDYLNENEIVPIGEKW